MNLNLLRMEIRREHDVVLARQRGRQVAAALKFDPQDQTRIATALSEIARNAFEYAGGGMVEFQVQRTPPALQISVSDKGRGIPNVARSLGGERTGHVTKNAASRNGYAAPGRSRRILADAPGGG